MRANMDEHIYKEQGWRGGVWKGCSPVGLWESRELPWWGSLFWGNQWKVPKNENKPQKALLLQNKSKRFAVKGSTGLPCILWVAKRQNRPIFRNKSKNPVLCWNGKNFIWIFREKNPKQFQVTMPTKEKTFWAADINKRHAESPIYFSEKGEACGHWSLMTAGFLCSCWNKLFWSMLCVELHKQTAHSKIMHPLSWLSRWNESRQTTHIYSRVISAGANLLFKSHH